MPRPSNREKILTEGLRVVHERGFANASVRDIAQAASVPLGSFTNHFPSKEAFGLEILGIYAAHNREVAALTLRNHAMPVRERISAYIDSVVEAMNTNDMRRGCLVGNFCAEVADQSEKLRTQLVAIFHEMRDTFAEALHEGVASGELPADLDCEATAGFIYASLQGAILIAKALRATEPMERYKKQVMEKILR